MTTTLRDLISDFASRLQELIDAHAVENARATVLGALGLAPRRGPGRPPKALAALTALRTSSLPSPAPKTRKKPPVQYCPVPYCRDVAAPIFGMVCAKHKDLPKAKIKAFREARRAKKLGLKPAKRGRTARAAVAKKARRAPRKVSPRKVSKPGPKVRARAPKKTATRVPRDTTPPTSTAPPPPSPSAA